MKKLLLIIVVVLFSCTKDDTFCWKCRRDVFKPGSYYSVVIDVCDMSEADIWAYQHDETYIDGTTTVIMTCWKEGDKAKALQTE